MFGGSGGDKSFNDLYRFDLEKQKWTKLEPKGNIPNPREGHVAIIGGDKMMIHGGVDQNETSFNDTYILVGINKSLNASYNTHMNASSTNPEQIKITTPTSALFDNQHHLASFDTNSTSASITKSQIQQVSSNRLKWYKCF